jgi:hypothetical protein
MVTQYDEKGKIFTQVIAKQPIKVTLQTNQQLIEGIIHIRPGMRIKDELNSQERFMAVTDATIQTIGQSEVVQAKFLVINVDHIVWVMPLEDLPH